MSNLQKVKKDKSQKIRFAVLATDTVLFTFRDGMLYVRLIPVNLPPYFNNIHGLPGGLIHPEENAEEATRRIIKDKGHIDPRNIYLEQLYTFSEVKRDPRGRVVAVAYLALAPWASFSKEEQKDSDVSQWFPVSALPKLAYDHRQIISVGLERLRSKIAFTTIISKLMPHEFTLTELENAYEAILDRGVDKRNFRKKILKLDVLEKSANERRGQRWRPAQLYKFSSGRVMQIDVL